MIDRLIVTVEMVAYICYGVQPIGSLPTYTYGAGGKKLFRDNFAHRRARALTYSSFMQMIPALRHWP